MALDELEAWDKVDVLEALAEAGALETAVLGPAVVDEGAFLSALELSGLIGAIVMMRLEF